MTNILLWKITIINGKTHYKWPFSIAFCMFTHVGVSENVVYTPLYPMVLLIRQSRFEMASYHWEY